MIAQLKLTNFRQFNTLTLDFDKELVIIHGDNTKGKSTILEALFLVTNGETPWGDFDDEFNTVQKDQDKYFRVEITTDDGTNYAYFRDGEKRQLRINGRNTVTKKFLENLSSIMFSPEQIDLLMISGSKRREFLDHILSKIDIEYSDILSKFHKSLKQRNAYLKRMGKVFYENGTINEQDQQLQYWSKQVAKYSSMIMSKRVGIISLLKSEDIKVVYKPSITLNLFEDMADTNSMERVTFERMFESVKRDVATGFTNLGAHRDDWTIFQGKEVKRFGSRGEKRVAIGRLIFLSLELISSNKGFRPTLLLDDISSELDKINTRKALSNKTVLKQQTFLTAIEIEHIPENLREIGQLIDLNAL